jgi:hypothetical protein
MIKHRVLVFVLGFAMALGGIAIAQKSGGPVKSLSPTAHPNLAAAQKLAQQAWDKLTAAQKANEFDVQGHAAKAKDLLVQVNDELKLAAEGTNAGK